MYPWTRRGRKTADPSDGSIENFAGERSLHPLGDERMNNNIQTFFLKTLILTYIYIYIYEWTKHEKWRKRRFFWNKFVYFRYKKGRKMASIVGDHHRIRRTKNGKSLDFRWRWRDAVFMVGRSKVADLPLALFTASARARSHRFMAATIRATNFTASIHESGPILRVIRLDNTPATAGSTIKNIYNGG